VHTIIGEGSFGCITLPAFPCHGDTEGDLSDLVSKVLSQEEATKELEEGTRLAKIDQLVSGSANTRTARYRFGVYALASCAFPTSKEEEESWQRAIQAHATKKLAFPTECGSSDRRVLLHMERAGGDCSVVESFGQVKPDALQIRPWLSALQNVARGLANMHAHGFVHFDAKPANFLWFGASAAAPVTAKLNDFGFACHVDHDDFNSAIAFVQPWFNYPPGACVAFAKMGRVARAKTLDKALRGGGVGRKRLTDAERAVFQAEAEDEDINALLQITCKYWGTPPPPTIYSARLKPPRVVSPGLRALQLQARARGNLPNFAIHRTPLPVLRKEASGDSTRKMLSFADSLAFEASGIETNAQTAAEKLTLLELGAAVDWFGFSLALAPFYNDVRVSALVKTFVDKAVAMKLSDRAALAIIEDMVARTA
jgi:hypothetical protein